MPTRADDSKKIKPDKPYDEFPLFAHPNGQWAKKIKGRPWYFGIWDDADAALQTYLDQIDDIHAGRDPKRQLQEQAEGAITVSDTVNVYLGSQEERCDRGEITRRHFTECMGSCKRLVNHFGRRVTSASLRAVDFSGYRKSFPDTWGASAIGLEIARVRAVFRWAAEAELIAGVPNFGPNFKKPGVRAKRKEKADREAEHGKLDFAAEEIQSLIDSSDGWLRACILLGINSGFGNKDCSGLCERHFDADDGWYDLRRSKTGIPRRSWLWVDTRESIQAAMSERPVASDERDNSRCFLTRRGYPLVNECTTDSGTVSMSDNIGTAFSKLLNHLDEKRPGMKRPGRSFYSLRRTYETVAGNTKDQVAVNFAMGHSDESMAAVYRQGIDDQRLIDVAEHVRQWLWTRKCDACNESQFSVDAKWQCERCEAANPAEELS
ncbi:MAG: hypothetical protein GY903_03300 [Fuerstiella sp.]|nr:hypothetical protein [Fuerstiella sp.]